MNRRFLFAAGILSWFTQANAEEFYRNKQEYKTSDAAKKYFGANGAYHSTEGFDFGSFEADISTNMDCGRIDIVTNFEAQFGKLRKQAEAFVKNKDQYIQAAPMMITCYMSPQVCAILRHDHLAFAQNLNLRAQACAAIDKYINSQAEVGAKQLRAESQQKCVQDAINNPDSSKRLDMASATEECQNPSSDYYSEGMPLRDLSSGIKRAFVKSKQKVLVSILDNIGEQQSYPFLSSLLGEIEVQTDGYWQPLWPHKMLKAYDVARNTIKETLDLTCGNLGATLSENAGANIVKQTLKDKLTQEDADNLGDLNESDRKIACVALGRSLGVLVVERSAVKHEAVLASALTNAALTDALRDEYRKRSNTAFETLRRAVESEQIPKLEEVRDSIRELASANRSYNRFIAAGLSSARNKNQIHKRDEAVDCSDTKSCE